MLDPLLQGTDIMFLTTGGQFCAGEIIMVLCDLYQRLYWSVAKQMAGALAVSELLQSRWLGRNNPSDVYDVPGRHWN